MKVSSISCQKPKVRRRRLVTPPFYDHKKGFCCGKLSSSAVTYLESTRERSKEMFKGDEHFTKYQMYPHEESIQDKRGMCSSYSFTTRMAPYGHWKP